ncbi:MAG TPA: serine/threonine-protein kinase, partial [Solirubrobacteraceae bacterium]
MGSSGQPRAEPSSLKLPERYRALRHLASGGMASVWCADDLTLGRTVAVKVLAERFAHDDIAVRRFKREARAAARVSAHAHVVTIYDVGDLEPEVRGGGPGRAFIVMEYLAGGTVADAIRVGAVRRQEAVRWIREAGAALDHAHTRGIVHRDIKPANFLLNRSRVLHVADFGIARLVSEDTITTAGELFGTAAYLSPEQALGREATGASDRYALAVAAFELLAGERPFGAQHFAAQARQHIEDPPPSASQRDRTLPLAVDDVLIRGMAKQADERFDTAGEFVDALETALSGGVPVTMHSPAPPRRERVSGRYLGAAAAAASAASAVRGPSGDDDATTRTRQGNAAHRPAGRRPRLTLEPSHGDVVMGEALGQHL